MASIINMEAFHEAIKLDLNTELVEAAKPILQQAVMEAEREMNVDQI